MGGMGVPTSSPTRGSPNICGFLSFLSFFCRFPCLGKKKNKHPLFLLMLAFPANKGLIKQIKNKTTHNSTSLKLRSFCWKREKTKQIGLAVKAWGSHLGASSPDWTWSVTAASSMWSPEPSARRVKAHPLGPEPMSGDCAPKGAALPARNCIFSYHSHFSRAYVCVI